MWKWTIIALWPCAAWAQPKAYVTIKADADCILKIDGDSVATLKANESQKIVSKAGTRWMEARTPDGKVWKNQEQLEMGQNIIFITFAGYETRVAPEDGLPTASIFELIENGDDTGLKKLLAAGTDVNAPATDGKYAGKTPLHCAIYNKHLDEALLLLQAGAKINAPDANGATALHLAASMEDVEAIKFLLSRGAAVNALDKEGKTPLGRVGCVTTQYCQQTKNLLIGAGGK
jgi:hypothetical protein